MLSTFRFSPNRLSLCARSTIVAASSDLQRRAAGGNAVNKYAGFRIPSSVDLVKAAPASLRPYLQIMRVDKPIGSTLNWGVLIAWAEMLPMDQFQSVIPLYLSTVLYTVIYDTIYTWQIGTVNIHDGSDCWNKFKSNQWMGAILLSGIIAGNLLRKSEENRQNT
uniref:Mitochondrial pyruvate carrier n=1 Tax=Heterorhabditis bacteriophora TaxID=37862 RepID=A0A1I7WJF4_HETBA